MVRHVSAPLPPPLADHDDVAADPDAIAACGDADPAPGGALGSCVTLPLHPLHVGALVVREVDDRDQAEGELLLLSRDVVPLLDGDCGQVGWQQTELDEADQRCVRVHSSGNLTMCGALSLLIYTERPQLKTASKNSLGNSRLAVRVFTKALEAEDAISLTTAIIHSKHSF